MLKNMVISTYSLFITLRELHALIRISQKLFGKHKALSGQRKYIEIVFFGNYGNESEIPVGYDK